MQKRDEVYKQLAINITYYRRKAELTQEELAAKIGISRTHMSNIETPNVPTPFTTEVVFNIAEALNVKLMDLFVLYKHIEYMRKPSP